MNKTDLLIECFAGIFTAWTIRQILDCYFDMISRRKRIKANRLFRKIRLKRGAKTFKIVDKATGRIEHTYKADHSAQVLFGGSWGNPRETVHVEA